MIGYREIMDIVSSDRSDERTTEETSIQIRGLGIQPEGVIRYAEATARVVLAIYSQEVSKSDSAEVRARALLSNVAVAISSAFEIGWRAHMRYGGGVDVDAPDS